jgi:hypothetical protein
MKTVILLIAAAIICLHGKLVFAQSISVELSVTWETGYDIFKKDSVVYTPKLNITYRNLSNTNYYFLKISDSRKGLPMLPYAGSIHPNFKNFEEYLQWRHDNTGRVKYDNYANKNFYVRIGGTSSYGDGWYAHSDTIDYYKGHRLSDINTDLQNIHEYIYLNNNSENTNEYEIKYYFSPLDLTPENILNAVKDKFVFLKANETYVDIYNLTGFKLVGGQFTFMINIDSFVNYVILESIWDSDKAYWTEQKMELPAVVGKYHLYSGSFFTNSITVKF